MSNITKFNINGSTYNLTLSEEEKQNLKDYTVENISEQLDTVTETATEALEKANSSVKTMKKIGDAPANSWITVMEFRTPLRPQYTCFNLRFGHNYENDNISVSEVKIDTVNISATGYLAYIEQVSQYGGVKVFDAVRVVNLPDQQLIRVDIHNNADVQKRLEVDITNPFISNGFTFTMPFTADTEVTNDKVIKQLTLIPNVGIIADRAIADNLGNKIDETYALKGNVRQYLLYPRIENTRVGDIVFINNYGTADNPIVIDCLEDVTYYIFNSYVTFQSNVYTTIHLYGYESHVCTAPGTRIVYDLPFALNFYIEGYEKTNVVGVILHFGWNINIGMCEVSGTFYSAVQNPNAVTCFDSTVAVTADNSAIFRLTGDSHGYVYTPYGPKQLTVSEQIDSIPVALSNETNDKLEQEFVSLLPKVFKEK